MNPYLNALQPYPFQKLRELFRDIKANMQFEPVILHIGEPKHPTPEFIKQALSQGLDGLANYPITQGTLVLREAIARWLEARYQLPEVNAETEVLPVNGSREALFAIAQTVIDPQGGEAIVISPNPFYQIYEGAALLAGAKTFFLNATPENGYSMAVTDLPERIWRNTQLLYVCSPGNPTGRVLTLDDWRQLFVLSKRYGFVIASDECYSEIYLNEHQPPLGALQAAQLLEYEGFPRLVVFGSLSKRSNVPGMRSGFAAGNAELLEKFLLYRTYHGCAMSPAVQKASIAAWQDEAHVVENRKAYREKFMAVTSVIKEVMEVDMPEAGFYLWARTPIPDTEFAQALLRDYNVSVLPGSFLARRANGINPGENFVRIALVAPLAQCLEAAHRIRAMVTRL
jgi:N-succinyldiaminopimelate aminotransferase